MANKEYKLAIQIAGMVESSLAESCNLTKKQLRAVAKEAVAANRESVSFGTAMKNAGDGIDSLWNGATNVVKTTAGALMAAGAAAGVVGGLAINAGSDFESAFAGVIKTVDATDKQLDELEEGLRAMAKNMPMTAVALAGIAEAAGQLGIETDNIEDFTKVMADLSVATNLTSEDAASQFAKFANITRMSQSEFGNLGSTVVALGNNFATTEADIVSMAMRLAGAGAQVGMSEADIMGMAAALSSVGIEAEAGGSAMSKVMVNMQLATEKGEDAWSDMRQVADMAGTSLEKVISTVNAGGKSLNQLGERTGYTANELKKMAKEARESEGDLESWASIANMSSSEFVKAFRDDAAGTISKFIVGLSDTERLGKSAILNLDEMDIKEVRLRDTLLRGANAGELFADALQMANGAFGENTALAKEAEQRYQTFESRVTMVGNRINDAGISLYQGFRDPLTDLLDMALDATDEIGFLDPKVIDDLASSFQAKIPTVVRHIGNAKDAILDFADPFLAVGDWMIENPDVIAGTLAGIGTTIVTLKLAKTITETSKAMSGLLTAMASNPITAAIGIAAIAGGAIVGVAAKIKIANDQLRKQKLNEAFGDITLSLSELEDTARFVLGEETLSKLGLAFEEMEKISTFADDINRSSNALQKLTWKINMGMELTESEQDSFKSSIDASIENSIALVEQAQYTAHLNVLALFEEGDEAGSKLIAGFDSMYEGISEEVKLAGRRLGDAYNDAMQDGIISTDEAKVIQTLQQQLARITDQVSESQLNAKLERIQFQFSGRDLDSETFQNLQAEIQAQLSEASIATNQAFEYDLGALNLQLTRSKSGEIKVNDSAYLTQSDYDAAVEKIRSKFLEKQMDIELKGVSFQTQTIMDAFSEDLDRIIPQMGDGLDTAMQEMLQYLQSSENQGYEWTYDAVMRWMNIDGLDKTTKAALSTVWSGFEPSYDELVALRKQYEDGGKTVPAAVQKGITDAATIGALAGSDKAMWELLGMTAASSEEYQSTLKVLEESGYNIPEEVANGMQSNMAAIEQGVDDLYNKTESYLDEAFEVFIIRPKVMLDFVSEYGRSGGSSIMAYQAVDYQAHAAGGIFSDPHIGLVAEAGPEAIIPLDGSQNAFSIWKEAGERLGAMPFNTISTSSTSVASGMQDNSSQVIFSPVINVGGGDENAIKRGLEEAYREFEQLMTRYQRTQQRLSF